MKRALVLLACAACAVSTRPAELVVLPPSPPPGPWLVLRGALDDCARAYGLAGEVRVRIVIDPDGGPGRVGSAYGDEFASCIGRTIARSRYRAYRGRVIEVPFTVSGPG